MKTILLSIRSNIENYQISVYDGCNVVRKRISTGQASVRLCVRSDSLRVVAAPLTDGYSTILFFRLSTSCQNVLSLYCNFPSVQTPTGALQEFTLTDANYGLPIDGTLSFTSA